MQFALHVTLGVLELASQTKGHFVVIIAKKPTAYGMLAAVELGQIEVVGREENNDC